MPVLPLFPLGTVLFPGAKLALQVFEPRYVALLRDLAQLPEQERVFGVVAIRSGHEVGPGAARELFDTGTGARIDTLTVAGGPPAPLIQLLTTGTRRFRVERVDDPAPTPYPRARVTWLEDGPPGDRDGDLAARLLAEVAAYRALVGARAIEATSAAVAPGAAAFAAMDAVLLALGDRQRVLDAVDVASRLRVALGLVRRERALVERLGSVTPPGPDLGAIGLN